jgi:hypothetical protein
MTAGRAQLPTGRFCRQSRALPKSANRIVSTACDSIANTSSPRGRRVTPKSTFRRDAFSEPGGMSVDPALIGVLSGQRCTEAPPVPKAVRFSSVPTTASLG